MKLKFTLQRSAGTVDLMATVDSATTVGELAGYLAASDPQVPAPSGPPEDATLSIVGAGTLDPRQPVVESTLRSGTTVSISRAGSGYAVTQRAPAAVVRVLDGPDAGREFPIPSGSSIIGRERGVEVRLNDPMASRRHARVNVGEDVEIIDLGSANGVQIDDVTVPRSVLRSTDVVQIGDTMLSVRRLQAPSAPASDVAGDGFVRSPRLDPVYAGREFQAPDLPERERTQRFPFVPLLAPIAMGAAIYLITKSLASLVFIGLSPVMLIGNAVESRFAGRANFKRALADFRADVATLVEDLEAAAADEVTMRAAEQPSLRDCTAAAATSSPLLWTRRPGERAFGDVRLGAGRLASRSTVELPSAKRGPRSVYRELVQAVAPFTHVDAVPVVAALSETALGFSGPRSGSVAAARSAVVQLAALHSPAELVVCAITSTGTVGDWDWLKWLPHTTSAHSPLVGRHLTSTVASGTALVSELEALVAARTGTDAAPAAPAVLVVVENDAAVSRSRLVGLAETGPRHNVFVVWRSDELAEVPAACKQYLDLDGTGVTGDVGYLGPATSVVAVQVDPCTAVDAIALAKRLAPVVDVGAGVSDASDLPRAVSLLALTGTELAQSPDAVIERWTESRSIVSGPFAPAVPSRSSGSLRAVLGQSSNEVHALDLRTDGPHALVGGTTGAGKSELLQSWILAMAAAHSPQRLTFLLVDYKGGAAFRDCVDLPHTVGLVTDLSPHLVRRALTSLSAELRHREHILAAHSAKDLVTLEKQGVPDTPPSLVIVVDEFAALIAEVPEFVDGVVNVAQRGRSLGIHLILATQRPAGVIKDNLRANTNLRLALRMADESDSTDVLGSSEAAFFDPGLPGRAVSKTGPGRLVPFQTGYAGGWTADETPPPDILVEELTFGSAAAWSPPEPVETAAVEPGPTDIRRLVDVIGQANGLAGIDAPRRPWLPELQDVYDLSDQARVRSRRTDTELVFGVRDDPDNQAQPTVAFHPDRDGNLAVYGTGGSGKSTLLRTIAIAAGFTVRGGPCHVYGIDFGGRGLAMLEALPHVGSIVAGGDHERITRLLGWLRGLIDERALRYSRVNAGTITDYRTLTGDTGEARILLLVDGSAAFRQAYETSDRQRWFDMFVSLATDGRPVGVHVVLSSDQRSGLTTALASAVQRRVVLRLSTSEEYALLGAPADILSPASPAGRGVFAGDEVQIAILGEDVEVGAQALAIKEFAEAVRRSGATEAAPIRRLPEHVPADDLPGAIDGLPVLGLAGETLEPLTCDPSGGFIVCGPPGSGRTATLCALAGQLRRAYPGRKLVLFAPRTTQLSRDPVWDATACGVPDVAAAAASLVAELPNRMRSDRDGVAVFVEAMPELSGGLADSALTDLYRLCVAEKLPFVVEGETASLNGGIGLMGQVKAARAGIALAPETSDGSSVFRTNFPPRLNRSDFPPGRGLLVGLGRCAVVQVVETHVVEHAGGGGG